MKIARFLFWLSCLVVLALLLAGPGVRLGLWPFPLGFVIIRYATLVGIAVMVLALLLLIVPRSRKAAARYLLLALALALTGVIVPLWILHQAKSLPPIHDITTDTVDVPVFVAVRPLREGAHNPIDYAGAEIATQQQQAYPEIRPLVLPVPTAEAFDRALATAEAMGWEVIASVTSEGRIEATATTPMFGFKDDVVIRIREAGTGSRIDLRSLSRVGRSDLGANARRIRAFLQRLAAA